MGVIDRLLGKRAKTSLNFAGEIETQTANIANARAKITAAQIARKAAINDLDAVGHRAADEDIAEAGREIERCENAIEKLKVAHAERVEVEARDAFRKEDDALAAEGVALTEMIRAKYPDAANTIAEIVSVLAAYQEKRKAMAARGKALGETSACRDAEDFRGVSAKRWSASWLAPEGGYTFTGPIEDAPRGSIVWKGDEPVSLRPDVTVIFKGGGGRPDSLVEAVGNLPKLNVGEGYFHEALEPQRPAHYGLR